MPLTAVYSTLATEAITRHQRYVIYVLYRRDFFRDKHLSGCPDLILIYTPCTVRAKKIGVKDPSDFYKDPTKYNGLKVGTRDSLYMYRTVAYFFVGKSLIWMKNSTVRNKKFGAKDPSDFNTDPTITG